MKESVIIGAGGFASEIRARLNGINTKCFIDKEYLSGDINVHAIEDLDVKTQRAVVCIGDPLLRNKMVKKLPKDLEYFTFIDPTAQIHAADVFIGEGSIICAGTIITTNIKIGKHAQLNLLSTIGHDTVIGNYFTTAPGAKISGNCLIGDRVYFGTNSSVRQGIKIADDVTIGLNAGVVKNIEQSGVYVGVPVKKIK
jgi:sugar O-acyltransferase (sialic acid O-acetyltransferase NeuD family)